MNDISSNLTKEVFNENYIVKNQKFVVSIKIHIFFTYYRSKY